MERKKYVLTDETMEVDGHILHRIVALKSFSSFEKGDKGGWIENENNLSQDGNCWVAENAKVYGNANVIDNAYVYGNAKVFDRAVICCNAYVGHRAKVYGNAIVSDYARIYDNVEIYDNAVIEDSSKVRVNSAIYEYAHVGGNASIFGDVKVHGRACVFGDAAIMDDAEVCGNELFITDETHITHNSVVQAMSDYLFIRNNFSSGRSITWTKSNDMYSTGCFFGTAEELIAKAEKDDEIQRNNNINFMRYFKADYFRAIVAMVEAFKKVNIKEDEYIKNLKISSK